MNAARWFVDFYLRERDKGVRASLFLAPLLLLS